MLAHLDEGVLVLAPDRSIAFANPKARRLLGYGEGEPIGGRCRGTTKGVDCEQACPLTFALERGAQVVRDFDTTYHRSDGHPVPLRITIVPLRDDDGEFAGAVEILRARQPDPGFVLRGQSERVVAVRSRLEQLARTRDPVVLLGDLTAAEDVARTLHRHAGLNERHFHTWGGDWAEIPSFPPGTLYTCGTGASEVESSTIPTGWKVVVALTGDDPAVFAGAERVELPTPEDLGPDLVDVVAAWARRLRPTLDVAPAAVDQLAARVRESGFDRAARIVRTAVASANGRLEVRHVMDAVGSACLFDEILSLPDPLIAVERRLIREALVQCEWRMQEAADRLGVSRVTLWRKLKDHGIERPCSGNASGS